MNITTQFQEAQAPALLQSVPANNWKIIEVFNKMRSNQLIVNVDYQRKLVWKRQHKFEFIDTILKNYPFPEVYLAPGNLDQEKLVLIDEIVDGQQRLSTIKDYILGQDVFALPKIPLKRFSELNPEEKGSFLNYEVSIRYLKSVTPSQIREIFQRINKTDYALNTIERMNAQWGESEFICFCKQIVEPDFEAQSVEYLLNEKNRKLFLEFFHGEEDEDGVFSVKDRTRMFALQYIMTLIATLDLKEYFARNERIANYVESYNETFPQAAALEARLAAAVRFIEEMPLMHGERWLNKANLFTLVVETDRVGPTEVDPKGMAAYLDDLDIRASMSELGLEKPETTLTTDEVKYLGYAREAVNQRAAREFRGHFMRQALTNHPKPR